MADTSLTDKQFSLNETVYKGMYKAALAVGFRILRVTTLNADDVHPSNMVLPGSFTGRKIQGDMQRALIGKLPALNQSFVEQAIERENWCYAIFDEDRLVSVGWYAPQTPAADVVLSFPNNYVYMHQGITDPEYRGQQLHGIGMALATRAIGKDGYIGLVSLIDANNHRSIRSATQMHGLVAQGRIAGRWVRLRTPAAKALGCSLTSPA